MKHYVEEEFLLLSGLQHFVFCKRQWALIHIEKQWKENFRTVDGSLMHEKAHDKAQTENRGDLRITRGMSVFSARLGVSGECDVVEFRRREDGVTLNGVEGKWHPLIVEYKRGKPNRTAGDEAQLCAQAMCLEEMLCCSIPAGALYYGEIRHRVSVEFTDELRGQVQSKLNEMHELYRRGHTPKVKPSKSCNACSLKELCVPTLMKRKSAMKYLHEKMEEAECDSY